MQDKQDKEIAKVTHDISGFAHKVHSLVSVTSFDEVRWPLFTCSLYTKSISMPA